MSGEMTGVLLGGVLLVGALPYIVTGAAAIGAVAGAVKLGGVVLRHVHETKSVQRYSTHYSSKQLFEMYGKMNHVEERRRKDTEELEQTRAKAAKKEAEKLESLTKKLEEAAERFREVADSAEEKTLKKEIKLLQAQVEEQKLQLQNVITRDLSQDLQKIQQRAHDESVRAIEEMQRLTRLDAMFTQEKEQDERMAEQLRVYVLSVIQDAETSMEMLLRMPGAGDKEQKLADLFKSRIQTARVQAEQGQTQAALVGAQTIISDCAMASLACTDAYTQQSELANLCIQELEALQEEMHVRRLLSFPVEGEEEAVEEDLNVFTQGEYEKEEKEIEHLREQIENWRVQGLSADELQHYYDEIRSVVRPNAEMVMETGQKKMIAFYEKQAAMDVVADFMMEQGYAFDWVETVGGDFSEEMVVHFVNPVTGCQVAVTLDEEMGQDELERLKMELMMFYSDGEAVSEVEKADLRKAMKQHLEAHGLGGSLSCSGRVHQASNRTEYNNQDSVREREARRLFNRNGT